jgi:hypothetical protein
MIPSEISQTQNTNIAWYQLCVKPKESELIEVEKRMVVAYYWGMGEMRDIGQGV